MSDAKTGHERLEQAHRIICELRHLVGRIAYREEVDEIELEDALRLANAWVEAWVERQSG